MAQPEAEAAGSVPALLLDRIGDTRTAHRVKRLGLWQTLSWDRYARRARAFGAFLASRGVAPGDRVALLAENRPEWLVADLGAQCAGAASVGVYATSSAEQLRYHLQHSDAVALVLEDAEQLEKWLEVRDGLPDVRLVAMMDPERVEGVEPFEAWLEEGERLDGADPSVVDARVAGIRPEDPAVFIYTSGTTGPPKGAMLSHANLLWAADALVRVNPIGRSDELLSFLPLSHIVERLITVVGPLRHGYTVSFTENLDTVMDNLREIRPTVFFAVPRIWEKIQAMVELHMRDAHAVKRIAYARALAAGRAARGGGRAAGGSGGRGGSGGAGPALLLADLAVLRFLRGRLGLDRVRVAISGAAPISPQVLGYFRAIGVNVCEGYGMTENCGLAALQRAERSGRGGVGEAVPGVEIRIAEDGEILTRSPGTFLGYHKDPEATARTVTGDGWLRTGDVGELDEDGTLRITDRKKDILITAGGKNVAPQKIENLLKSGPYVGDAVVIGDGRRYLVALLVLDEDNVAAWAADRQIGYTTYRDLASHPEVRELIEGEVAKVNAELARVETIKRFEILPKRLHHEDGEVTATLKVKRAAIARAYHDLIEGMYA